MTNENEEGKPLLERSYFSGGKATPKKLRDLATDMVAKATDPSALALLSGCSINFLLEFAAEIEAQERSFDAIKVGKTYGEGTKVVEDLTGGKNDD